MPDPPLPATSWRRSPPPPRTRSEDAYWAIFDTEDLTAAGIGPGQRTRHGRAGPHRRASPKRTASSTRPRSSCLLTDREQLTSYLRFPAEHHKRIRHSNFIERTFGETRRRIKVIGRLPGETSCLNLVWAVLDRASRGWRGVTTTSNRAPPAARPAPPAPRPAHPDPAPESSRRGCATRTMSQPSPNIHPRRNRAARHLHRLLGRHPPHLIIGQGHRRQSS